MPNTDHAPTTAAIADVRAKLLEDLAPIDVFAAAVDRSTRTIARMIATGMIPTVRLGNAPFVIVSAARAALMATATTRHAPGRRGRPAGKRAA